MSLSDTLELRVATPHDVLVPLTGLLTLVLLAATLSARPVLLTSLLSGLLLAGWGAHILDFYKVNFKKLTLVIYSDGQVRVKLPDETTIRGLLVGPQWCIRQFAILHVEMKNTTRNLLVVSALQKNTDEFRRLNLWLKQDLFRGIKEVRMP